MFNYWSLSPELQKLVASIVPKLNTWTLNLTKTNHQDWVFSIPLIKDEALTGGTEQVLDYYYQQLTDSAPQSKDEMLMKVSTSSSVGYTTKITDPKFDGFGHIYHDSTSNMDVWLCPVLEVMFGEPVPNQLYVTFQPSMEKSS